jgi:alpha,alpha-trehalose phosphorylase
MTQNGLDTDNWQIVEQEFQLEDAMVNETLFALGNGYLGMRGTFEEGLGRSSLEGTYINGFFESAPITYGEKFIGFAENKQTILNLANSKVIRLILGDRADGTSEEFNLLSGNILSYRRALDMRKGVLHRSVQWQSPKGKQVLVEVDRVVLYKHRHTAVIHYQLTPLNFDGPITLISGIDGAIRQSEHAEDDPRLGTHFAGEVLRLVGQSLTAETAILIHRTVSTQYTVACGMRNIFVTPCAGEAYHEGQLLGYLYKLDGRRGQAITMDKIMVYVASFEPGTDQLEQVVLEKLDQAENTGVKNLYTSQRDYLANFWDVADILIEGDDTLQRGIRFNMFHLLQSAGQDGRTNIAAKGLTGLGYEGHYFWDTEIYILPFFLYTYPEIGRKLMEYRYRILDKARERAREMAHPHGALYPWRTINGAECSANFPTGTAQYHINADIAFAIQRYYDATEDDEFMAQYGIEILCETARLWVDAGDYIDTHGGRFCINGVTGPDEYQIIVNNNAYTNFMARENLRFASETVTWLKQKDVAAYERLAHNISLQEDEPAAWAEAAEKMYIPYNVDRGIIPQDDAFLNKAVWDFKHTPHENYPLLLHYHPLIVTRYQVCKQADLVLAEFLLHDQFDRAQKLRDFNYYEPITTHDSSLSGGIFGIMAAELGDTEKAYRYFSETATMDLENKHGNTRAGIHAANMAGAWQGIIFGFAGMRAKRGLSFNPVIPRQWRAYAFKIRYRERLISVRVTPDQTTIKLLSGEPLEIRLWDTPTWLT